MAKDRDELKARLAKISQTKTVAEVPEETDEPMEPVIPEQEKEPQDIASLQKSFEAKKKALIAKEAERKRQAAEMTEDVEDVPAGEGADSIATMIEEYQNVGKYRTEMVFQLVALNKTLKLIDNKLGAITTNLAGSND